MTEEELNQRQHEAMIYLLLEDDRFRNALEHFAKANTVDFRDFAYHNVLNGEHHKAVVNAAKAEGIESFWAELQAAAKRHKARKTSGA